MQSHAYAAARRSENDGVHTDLEINIHKCFKMDIYLIKFELAADFIKLIWI